MMMNLKLVYVFLIYNIIIQQVECNDDDNDYCNLNQYPNLKLTLFHTKHDLEESNGTDVKVFARDLSKYRNNYNVYVYGTKIQNVCNTLIKQLSGVDEIEFQDVGTITIHPYSFAKVYNLRSVSFYYNTLKNISSGAFSNSTIVTLRIESNKIDYIARDAFDNMAYLEMLNLNENNLRRINSDWFRNCPRLSLLDLSNNGIKYLQESVFENLVSGRTCNIKEHKVSCPEIILTGNKISNISELAFKGLDTINHLVLDNNQIKILQNVFDNNTINILSLKSNLIECIDDDVMFSFLTMGAVYLEYNNIRQQCANEIREFNDNHDVTISL